jgi:hypothetical protein
MRTIARSRSYDEQKRKEEERRRDRRRQQPAEVGHTESAIGCVQGQSLSPPRSFPQSNGTLAVLTQASGDAVSGASGDAEGEFTTVQVVYSETSKIPPFFARVKQ